jgi:hypothetical protein
VLSVARAILAIALLVLVARAPAASAAPGLFVGVSDDGFLWRGGAAVAAAQDLGLAAVRVTVPWDGRSELSMADASRLDDAAPAAASVRIVASVFGKARAAPQDDAGRDAYCAYARDLLARYPTINDVVIWNEPNLGFFWQPRFTASGASAAPAAYEKLLARCWDVLHAFRPTVNVLTTTSPSGNDNPAAANASHSPGAFIRKLGSAYRASGRTTPIFDTIGHNPYGVSSSDPPWRQHFAPAHVAEADLDRLVQAFDDGFRNTKQPTPGRCTDAGQRCASIWYLETGYQTVPDAAHQALYTGRENDDHPVADAVDANAAAPTQSAQVTDGIELAYCQPYVDAIFNFLLWDEPDLARWQSGVFWADGTQKASYTALRRVVERVKSGSIDCRQVRAAHAEARGRPADRVVERIDWPTQHAYSSFNQIWRFGIEVRVNAAYRATLRNVQGCLGSRSRSCVAASTSRERCGVTVPTCSRFANGGSRAAPTGSRSRLCTSASRVSRSSAAVRHSASDKR